MDWTLLLDCLVIFGARVIDVSLGTLRTAAVVQGRRMAAWAYAFAGMLIWILVVADVITNLEKPAYIFSFAFGFATGTTVGMWLENWLAHGRRVIRIFSRKGAEIAQVLRDAGFITTLFKGEGRDGPTHLLFIEARRRDKKTIHDLAVEVDEDAYFIYSSSNSVHR